MCFWHLSDQSCFGYFGNLTAIRQCFTVISGWMYLPPYPSLASGFLYEVATLDRHRESQTAAVGHCR
jgi:hypothetical protein